MNADKQKVIVRTVARNAEKTLERTIESIYAQTHDNWELHMVDNASSDNTLKIMQEYANKDPRLRVFINEGNYVWKKGNRFTDYYNEYDLENTFMCHIDADDEYKPGFMEDLLAFADEYRLDIACSGFETVDDVTKQIYNTQMIESILILEGDGFDKYFRNYHVHARYRCMKLFRLTMTDKFAVTDDVDIIHGGDTAEALEYFRNADRIGFMPKAHYIYYANPSTISYNWYERRPKDLRILHDRTIDYLMKKTGHVSQENYLFLCDVYFNAVWQAVVVAISDKKLSVENRINALYDLYVNKHTRELIGNSAGLYNLATKEQLCNTAINWIDTNADKLTDRQTLNKAVEILAVIDELQK